mgnify:CR=1 FL=1
MSREPEIPVLIKPTATTHTQEVPMHSNRLIILSSLDPQALVKEARLLRIIQICLGPNLTPAGLATCRRLGMPHRKLGEHAYRYNPLESLAWLEARHISSDPSTTMQEAA